MATAIVNRVILGVQVDTLKNPDFADVQAAGHKKNFEKWLLEQYENKKTSSLKTDKDISDIRSGVVALMDPNKRYHFKMQKFILNANGEVCQLKKINKKTPLGAFNLGLGAFNWCVGSRYG